MSSYEIAKFIHVLAAVIWVGGALMSQVFYLRARAANNKVIMDSYTATMDFAGGRIFGTAGIVGLITGIYLVSEGNWTYSPLWIKLGLILFATSIVIGAAFYSTATKKLDALMKEKGPEAPETKAKIKQIELVSRVDLLILVSIIFVMVTKPGS